MVVLLPALLFGLMTYVTIDCNAFVIQQNDGASPVRKSYENNEKRFEVRKRLDEVSVDKSENTPSDKSVIMSLDSGLNNAPNDMLNAIMQTVKGITNVGSDGDTNFKSRNDFGGILKHLSNAGVKVSRANNSQHPTIVWELNTESLTDMVRNVLSSPALRRYADVAAQKAAVIFNVIKEEMQKHKDENEKTRPVY